MKTTDCTFTIELITGKGLKVLSICSQSRQSVSLRRCTSLVGVQPDDECTPGYSYCKLYQVRFLSTSLDVHQEFSNKSRRVIDILYVFLFVVRGGIIQAYQLIERVSLYFYLKKNKNKKWLHLLQEHVKL